MESTHLLNSSAAVGSMSSHGMCRRLENLVPGQKGQSPGKLFHDKACESASHTNVILKILQHTDEHFTGTVAVTTSPVGKCVRHVANNLESATFVLVLFPTTGKKEFVGGNPIKASDNDASLQRPYACLVVLRGSETAGRNCCQRRSTRTGVAM